MRAHVRTGGASTVRDICALGVAREKINVSLRSFALFHRATYRSWPGGLLYADGVITIARFLFLGGRKETRSAQAQPTSPSLKRVQVWAVNVVDSSQSYRRQVEERLETIHYKRQPTANTVVHIAGCEPIVNEPLASPSSCFILIAIYIGRFCKADIKARGLARRRFRASVAHLIYERNLERVRT